MVTILAWIVAALLLIAAAVVGYFLLTTRRIAAEAERSVPRAGKTVTIDGDTIHYVEQGQGTPILFIHGLGAQLHQFTHSVFPAMGEGYRLVALDRPGSGYSVRARSGARLSEQADLIAAFIAAVGLGSPLVVAHSLGGAIALSLALRHPDKVAGLALLSPLTNHVPRPPEAFGGLHIASPLKRRIVAETVAVPAAKKMAKATLDFLFSPQQPPSDYLTRGGGNLGLRPSHFHATSSDLVAVELDLPMQQQRYGELTMPIGIMHGDADRAIDHRQQALWMADKVPNIEIEILEGVGHMPQFAAADKVAAFVKRMAARAFAA